MGRRPGPGARLTSLDRGFTLLELIVVISLISILAAIAMPQFRIAIIQAREAVLKEDLYRLRQAIDQYQADKGVYPPTLESLVEEGYIRRLEADPMTHAADWEVVYEDVDSSDPSTTPGVYDVHSASTNSSLRGTPYNEW
ncbi:MAG: type II secretion system protein [Vicinamibacteria bacterium]|nr:type II secretion system protein [Vicinamibacteria bacterium]